VGLPCLANENLSNLRSTIYEKGEFGGTPNTPNVWYKNIGISNVMRLSIYIIKNWHIEKPSKTLFINNEMTDEYPCVTHV
jgi:hypothetical protein